MADRRQIASPQTPLTTLGSQAYGVRVVECGAAIAAITDAGVTDGGVTDAGVLRAPAPTAAPTGRELGVVRYHSGI